jgi:DNA-binding NarL/FixJ family response regulator
MSRVLICDDAAAYGILFARWMRDAGVGDVEHARTAAEAVDLAQRLQPAVIVVDHLLPDAISSDLVPRLRQVAPDARVLLISGMPDDRLAEMASAAGADGHIGKASTADAMRAAVTALMH